MPVFLSGKSGKMRVNTSTAVSIQEWSDQIKGDPQDVTNSESGGAGEWVGGILDHNFSFRGVFDLGMSTPLTTLLPNTIVPACIFYVNGTGGASLTGSIIIDSFNIVSVVRGKVTADIQAKSTGAITPSGM